jgi:flagellar protein FliS
VLQLYDAALTDLGRADLHLATDELEQAHGALVHAQEVVMELVAGLDLSAGEIAVQLSDLYHYMYRKLMHANVQKDREAIAEVTTLLRRVRDAWQQVVHAQPQVPPSTAARTLQA